MTFLAVPVTDIAKELEGHPWMKLQDINKILPNLIGVILTMAVIVFLILIIIAGIQWMTAGGDQEAIAKAKSRLTSALIGIIIVFSAWAILNLVKYLFGIPVA